MDFGYTVLECRHYVAPSATSKIVRTVKDYEIDIYLEGGRTMAVGDKRFEIHKHDIVFRKPGQRVYSLGNYDCYVITLDFSGTKSPENYSRNVIGKIQPRISHPLLDMLPTVFPAVHIDDIIYAAKNLSLRCELNDERARGLSWELLCILNADAQRARNRAFPEKSSIAESVRRHILRNYGAPLSLEGLADMFSVNKYHLVRLFKNQYRCTPIDFYISVRLSNAREFLMTTDMSVKEISMLCGYSDEAYFVKQYKKKYGIPPHKHRNINRAKPQSGD